MKDRSEEIEEKFLTFDKRFGLEHIQIYCGNGTACGVTIQFGSFRMNELIRLEKFFKIENEEYRMLIDAIQDPYYNNQLIEITFTMTEEQVDKFLAEDTE